VIWVAKVGGGTIAYSPCFLKAGDISVSERFRQIGYCSWWSIKTTKFFRRLKDDE
jgi:hypothetical protein